MKKAVACCVALTLLVWMGHSAFADKGRRYYEEAGHVLWEINTDEKIIAITFDDGPHRKYTPQLLELLAAYDAKATFFVVGQNVEKHPDVIMRMYEDGHEVAIHTYSHSYRTNIPDLLKEIKKTKELIYSITGETPKLFRPVGGAYTEKSIEAVAREGYKVVLWSWHQDTMDWKNPGVPNIVDKVLEGSRPGNVVLFHDGGERREQTVQAMQKILPELTEQGYRFVTISELLAIQETMQKSEEQELKGKK